MEIRVKIFEFRINYCRKKYGYSPFRTVIIPKKFRRSLKAQISEFSAKLVTQLIRMYIMRKTQCTSALLHLLVLLYEFFLMHGN